MKALETEMNTAAAEILSKLNPSKAFPSNNTSIPGFASCPSCVTANATRYPAFGELQLRCQALHAVAVEKVPHEPFRPSSGILVYLFKSLRG
jgi:hypothetical protein